MSNQKTSTPEWKPGETQQAPAVPDYPDFEPGTYTFEGASRAVYKSGGGPAIIVIHEIPGIYDEVYNFARRLNNEGFTTYLPSLMGTPGKKFSNGYAFKQMAKLCVAKEFNRFAFREEAPVANWLRALARDAHRACWCPAIALNT